MKSGTFNILVGIDFSDSSAGAMYHAVALAERLDAVLHLCHVAASPALTPVVCTSGSRRWPTVRAR